MDRFLSGWPDEPIADDFPVGVASFLRMFDYIRWKTGNLCWSLCVLTRSPMLYAESGKMFTFYESHLEICFSAFLPLNFKAARDTVRKALTPAPFSSFCVWGKPGELSCCWWCRHLDVETPPRLSCMWCSAVLSSGCFFLAVCSVVLWDTQRECCWFCLWMCL